MTPAPRPAAVALALLGLLLTLTGGARAGEKVKFGHLSIADGLPESGITTLLQDRLGFLWLGTANGLVRYDGYEFTTYKPDPDDPHSLGGRIVLACTKIAPARSGSARGAAGSTATTATATASSTTATTPPTRPA